MVVERTTPRHPVSITEASFLGSVAASLRSKILSGGRGETATIFLSRCFKSMVKFSHTVVLIPVIFVQEGRILSEWHGG